MSKFCESCGQELSDGDRFCFACGHKVQESFSNKLNNNVSKDNIKERLFNKERLFKRDNKNLEDRFDSIRDDVSHLIPGAAQKLNVSPNDCYLTFKIAKHERGQFRGTKWQHHDKIVILMTIFDDKVSYVVLGRLTNFTIELKSISLEEEVYSLYFNKISGISYSKAGLDLTMIGGETITLRATDLFGNSINKELNDKFNNYNEKNISNAPNSQVINKADTLIKYKELLDAGVLTQEEFDKLKDELINS